MYTSVLLGLAVTLGAPDAKDPPKAEIIGEWLAVSIKTGGFDLIKEKEKERNIELRFTFVGEGRVTISNFDGSENAEQNYKIDSSKSPPEIDIYMAAIRTDPPFKGIFKVEGDKLTICYVEAKDARPTKFESKQETKGVLITFERVKK